MSGTEDHTDLNRGTYDRIAARYKTRQLELVGTGANPFRELERRWTERLPPAAHVGDFGCGPAMDGVRFAAAGHRVVGFDLSRGMLTSGHSELPGRLAQADLRALPLFPGSLDGAWCVAALLHVPEFDTEFVLEGFRATLRPAGVLALVTALGDGAQFEAVPYATEEHRWYVYRGRSRLEGQIQEAGFRLLWSDQVDGNRTWLTALAEAQ